MITSGMYQWSNIGYSTNKKMIDLILWDSTINFASSQWMKSLELKNSFLNLCDSLFHPKNIVNCLLFSHNLLFYKTLINSKDLLLTSTDIPQIKHQHLLSDYLQLYFPVLFSNICIYHFNATWSWCQRDKHYEA